MGLGLPDGGHLTHGYYVSLFRHVNTLASDISSNRPPKRR